MAEGVVAMVQHGERDLRETQMERPALGPGAALLRMEANGLCGSDIESLRGEAWATFPRVMGHEIVGTIEQVADGGRHDCKVGDRVAVHPWLPCGHCRACLAGEVQFCAQNPFANAHIACYGFIPTDNEPGLWGGYASHVYLHPNAVLYHIPAGVPFLDAALWQPLAAGIHWAVETPQVQIGSTVLILGCGQRGLASVLATRAAGAGTVIVTGLTKDARKLDLARTFGADHAVDVETEDLHALVKHVTRGEGVDVAVDTSSFSVQPVIDAIELTRKGGTAVFAGLKAKAVDGFPLDEAVMKGVRMLAVQGMPPDAYRRAMDLLAANDLPLGEMRTHVFDFRDGQRAVDTLAGRVEREDAINVVLENAGS